MHFQMNHLEIELVAEYNKPLISGRHNLFKEGIYIMSELLKWISSVQKKKSNFQRDWYKTLLPPRDKCSWKME